MLATKFIAYYSLERKLYNAFMQFQFFEWKFGYTSMIIAGSLKLSVVYVFIKPTKTSLVE